MVLVFSCWLAGWLGVYVCLVGAMDEYLIITLDCGARAGLVECYLFTVEKMEMVMKDELRMRKGIELISVCRGMIHSRRLFTFSLFKLINHFIIRIQFAIQPDIISFRLPFLSYHLRTYYIGIKVYLGLSTFYFFHSPLPISWEFN